MNSDLYYSLRPVIPRRMQIMLRRWRIGRQLRRNHHCWPISEAAGSAPPGWPGWPQGKRFALVLTHDVEVEFGLSRCIQLAKLEEERGLRSGFGFVPRRYETPELLRRELVDRGFEILVHDFNHDGKLFRNRKSFEERRAVIDDTLVRWETRGFASGSAHHNLPWISELDIDYDTSTYDVDPFEPQPCGLGRIFPFWVQAPSGGSRGFVELPYTLPQDFTLFVLMREQSTSIWRTKLDWIAERGGMALVKSHPDYMAFDGHGRRGDSYPVHLYTDLLDYVRARYDGEFWLATPSEVARFWRGLSPEGKDNAIELRDTFCETCRGSHRAGLLSHYRPAAAAR